MSNDNRGGFMISQWTELKKSGGIAPSALELMDVLAEGGTGKVLSRDEVLERVAKYFNSCIREDSDEKTGEVVRVWVRNPTKTGLALAIGVAPQTLIDYVSGVRSDGAYFSKTENTQRIVGNDSFDILRKAYGLIEMFYEEKLGENRNNAGTIFWLNNLRNRHWSNEQMFKFDTAKASDNYMSVNEIKSLLQETNNNLDKDEIMCLLEESSEQE